MTADERALLAAIHADPTADLPRLVYADYLDDIGHDHRASFIRLQCDWHRAMVDPSYATYANHLYNRLHDEFPDGIPGPPNFGGAVGWGEYTRGLPIMAEVDCHEITSPLAEVFEYAPLRSVTMWDPNDEQVDRLVALPADITAAMTALHVRPGFSHENLAKLARRFGPVFTLANPG